jgi:1-acyl-sn-glycerol-3-phosphate acyltransferase
MKHAPFLGQICEAGGCLYVERRSRSNLDNEISDITKALKSGLNVIVFPEATSTNGDELLRFKSPLFTAAIQAGVNVLPLAINYHAFDGQVLAKKNRDKLFWYGDMEFGNHFFNVLGIREIIVSLSLCERISANTCLGPKELAQASQLAVSKVFRPVIA